MNKYQEALDNYSENVDYRDYSTKTVDIVNESFDTLQELVYKLGKLEDIMKHFKIVSIYQLINILEAWEIIKREILITDGGVIHLAIEDDNIDYEIVEKALEVEDE